MPRPSIVIVTPHAAGANNGNWRTATRWARMLREHYRVIVQAQPAPKALAPADCLVALHARRSHAVIRAWQERNPGCPVVVVLTGTDLYRDLPEDADALDSLAVADRLVVLQEEALHALPRQHRSKARVVYQSARTLRPVPKRGTRFHCVFVGHLREEKDPATLLHAWARLPAELPVQLTLIGGALNHALAEAVGTLVAHQPRVRWLGARPHGWTRQAIKRAHVLIVPSRMEGGANVIAEAVTAGTPVLASRVPGNVGMLGRGYRGYFPAGDAARLARLIQRCRDDTQFGRALTQDCHARRALFAPARERAALLHLMQEVWRGA